MTAIKNSKQEQREKWKTEMYEELKKDPFARADYSRKDGSHLIKCIAQNAATYANKPMVEKLIKETVGVGCTWAGGRYSFVVGEGRDPRVMPDKDLVGYDGKHGNSFARRTDDELEMDNVERMMNRLALDREADAGGAAAVSAASAVSAANMLSAFPSDKEIV